MTENETRWQRISRATYGLAFLLIVLPIGDFLANAWPINPSLVSWRYGSLGLLSGYTLTPVLGSAMACLLALKLEHLRVLKIFSWINLTAGVLLLILAGVFLLDGLQVRSTVPVDERTFFEVGIAKALVKHLLVGASVVWFGLAGRRAAAQNGGGRSKSNAHIIVPE